MPANRTAFLLALALLAGCGDLSTTGGAAPSQGQSPAATVPVEPTPTVEITTPQPASFLAPGQVAVEGRALAVPGGQAPIQEVRLNGQPVAVAADGTFRSMLQATAGVNVFEASAVDATGREGHTAVGMLAGDWRSTASPIRDAARFRITDSALDGVGKILEAVLWATDLTSALQKANPIYGTQFLWTHIWVDIQQIRFRDVHVALDSQPDGIHVNAALFDPIIDVTVQADLGFGAITAPEPVALTADRIDLTGRISLGVQSDRRFKVEFLDLGVQLPNFRAITVSTLLSSVEPLIRQLVKKAIRDQAVKALTQDVQPLVNQGIRDYFTPTQPYNIFGNPFLIDVRGEHVRFDPQGFEVDFVFDAPQVPGTPARGAPGTFATPGAAPPFPTPAPGVFLTADDDAVNRLLYGLWVSGGLDFDLDTQFLTQRGLRLPIALDLGALKAFVPELAGVGADSAPIAIRIRPLLPPVASFPGQPDLARLEIGEVALSVLVDRGNGWETLLGAAAHASMGLGAALTSDGLKFSANGHPQLVFDVRDEPIVEMDNRRLEVMLSVLLTPFLPSILNGADILPVPHLKQLRVFNTQAYADGPEGEHLTITGELTR